MAIKEKAEAGEDLGFCKLVKFRLRLAVHNLEHWCVETGNIF